MAHYDVTHACGHDERIELFGKTSERERRIEWAEDIRTKCIDQLLGQVRNLVARIPGKATAQQSAAFAARCNAIASMIANETSAAWWIENRDDIDKAVVREVIKAHA